MNCANETKTVVVSKPREECDMEPQQSCRFITKMVPHLVSREECVDVPRVMIMMIMMIIIMMIMMMMIMMMMLDVSQEVCGTSREPVKKMRPAIMNWCWQPGQEPALPGLLTLGIFIDETQTNLTVASLLGGLCWVLYPI